MRKRGILKRATPSEALDEELIGSMAGFNACSDTGGVGGCLHCMQEKGYRTFDGEDPGSCDAFIISVGNTCSVHAYADTHFELGDTASRLAVTTLGLAGASRLRRRKLVFAFVWLKRDVFAAVMTRLIRQTCKSDTSALADAYGYTSRLITGFRDESRRAELARAYLMVAYRKRWASQTLS